MNLKYLSIAFILISSTLMAGEIDEISKELSNPNSSLASLKFKTQYRKYSGDLPNADSQHGIMNIFQPVLPFALDNGDSIIFRPAIPYHYDLPAFNTGDGGFGDESGLGDIEFDLVYSQTSPTGLITAYGMAGKLPTGEHDSMSTNKYSLGPELLIGKKTQKTLFGIFPNHQWDIAGSGDKAVNKTTSQVFAVYFPGGGWSVGSSPIVSYDWEEEQWDLPINVTVGKTMILNKRPWKFDVEANYYTEKSDIYGSEWMFGLTITPVVENMLEQFF